MMVKNKYRKECPNCGTPMGKLAGFSHGLSKEDLKKAVESIKLWRSRGYPPYGGWSCPQCKTNVPAPKELEQEAKEFTRRFK